MKQSINDEPPLPYTVLVALIVTVLAIIAFMLPAPPVEAPAIELKEIPKHAEVAVMEVVEEPTLVLRSELEPVCGCESVGDPTADATQYHYEDDGVTLLTGRINSSDKGMCQINMDAHSETIDEMGLDILSDEEDYITYTNWLYDTQGLTPWKYSQHCWDN